MRQAYRQRVLPAHWATKFEATFNHAAKAAPLGTPFGVDRGPTVVITDTGNNLSTNGSALVCAGGLGAPAWGDPGVWSSLSYARVAGRALLGRMAVTDASTYVEFGWDNFQSGALDVVGFQLSGDFDTLYATCPKNPALYLLLDNVIYDLAVVLQPNGALLLLKLATANLWTLLYRTGTLTTTPVHAAISNYNAAFTLDDMRVVDLPGAWASQWGMAPVYVATPPSVTPTFVASLIEGATLNGNMETGDPPTGWAASNATLDGVADERTGGAGAQSLEVTSTAAWGMATQGVNWVANTWYSIDWWGKNGTAPLWLSLRRPDSAAWFDSIPSNAAWGNQLAISRYTGPTGAGAVYCIPYSGTIGVTARFDDIILKPFTFTTMLGTAYAAASEGWFEVGVTIPTGHVGGMMICLDDETNPQNYLLIYHDRTNLNVIECVAGVQTSLLATAATYAAAGRICCQKIGNTMRCYYRDALVGAALTTTATTNTKMTTFSSDVSITFQDLAFINAYHTLPSWA